MQISTKHVRMKDLVTEMIKEGGWTSLWRGNLLNVLKTAPKQALRFAFYDKFKMFIKNKDGKKHVTNNERFLAGAVAGVFAQTICFPLEVLKVRLSIRKTGQYNGVFDAIRKIYKNEGIQAFGNHIPILFYLQFNLGY